MSCEQGDKVDGNVVVCYNKSFSIENQLNIDNLILSRWNAAMNNGFFRYSIDSVREKVLPGKFRFLVQYQPNRSTNRRPPQNMTSVSQEFNPDKFNFTRINRKNELVCELRNKDCDKSPGVPAKAEARDVVIINVSPIDLGHCLLVPELELCQPQILTIHGIQLALAAILLSGRPDMKLAFNSLCGYASVNHQHFHLYYQSHHLPVQGLPLTRVSRGTGNCILHTMDIDCYPAPAWVWLLKMDSMRISQDAEEVSSQVFRVTSWMTAQDIAHNLLITRGSDVSGGDDHSHVRIIVWARETVRGAKDSRAFVMAVCELSGQMLVYDEETYGNISEDEIVRAMGDTVQETYSRTKEDVMNLF